VEAGATGATTEAQPCPAKPDGQDNSDITGTRSHHPDGERSGLVTSLPQRLLSPTGSAITPAVIPVLRRSLVITACAELTIGP
jgi:hypothetical protein